MQRLLSLAAMIAAFAFAAPAQAQTYKADPVHSSVLWQANHVNVGHVWGRFNDFSGTFKLDAADPTKDTFEVEVKVASVDSNQPKRDAHLKSPDFFNAAQYPTITFKSTSVKKGEGKMLIATGTLTMHGVTKPFAVPLELLGKGEFPAGVKRQGLEATIVVKQSEFDMKGIPNAPGAVGDDIKVVVSFEGIEQ